MTTIKPPESIWDIKNISDNLNLIFNTNNKQIRLNEIQDDPDFMPFFSQEKEASFMVPGRKSFKAFFSWSKKTESIKLIINDMGDLPKGTLFLVFFNCKDQTFLAQCELVDIASNMTRSYITNYLTLKALDPRKHARKEINKEISIYTIPSQFVEGVKSGQSSIYRRQLNKPTSQSSKKILAQDYFEVDSQEVLPVDAIQGLSFSKLTGTTLDISLGGIGFKTKTRHQDSISQCVLVYVELVLHLRGIYRNINVFASPRMIKPQGSDDIFVAIMFIDSLLPTVFK